MLKNNKQILKYELLGLIGFFTKVCSMFENSDYLKAHYEMFYSKLIDSVFDCYESLKLLEK